MYALYPLKWSNTEGGSVDGEQREGSRGRRQVEGGKVRGWSGHEDLNVRVQGLGF